MGNDISPVVIKQLYKTMKTIRLAEENIADLISNHEIICPCHLCIGHEAIAAGVCASLKRKDWVFHAHRNHGHYLAKGGNLNAMMAEIYGKSAGCSSGRGGSMHLAEPGIGLPGSSAIVAGTIPLSVGAALAFQSQNIDSVAVVFFGDGAVCEGVFYESLNLASLLKLPVIFVCENNLYATHLPVAEYLADTDIHKKSAIFNMPGSVIDGNDAVTVYKTTLKAVKRARDGYGPTLIECLTYRWLGHVGPGDDIDKGLRNKSELSHWKRKCPIKRLEKYMIERGLSTKDELENIEMHIEQKIQVAVSLAKLGSYPAEDTLSNHVFKEDR